jgi:acetate kinase
VREKSLSDLEFMGIKVDKNSNYDSSKVERAIHGKNSQVQIFVIPTNEELVIALDTMQIVKSLKPARKKRKS